MAWGIVAGGALGIRFLTEPAEPRQWRFADLPMTAEMNPGASADVLTGVLRGEIL
ncbi:hypothetical protein [Streptomyces dioscori]|uniref:hypothetical protein n=1 Tax=Streptomyces dioscori TaxID=2109333 RepID=UPI00131E743E|nr:hypothetical protein [Streptomyces dioscori]